jgi:hypothetical protein
VQQLSNWSHLCGRVIATRRRCGEFPNCQDFAIRNAATWNLSSLFVLLRRELGGGFGVECGCWKQWDSDTSRSDSSVDTVTGAHSGRRLKSYAGRNNFETYVWPHLFSLELNNSYPLIIKIIFGFSHCVWMRLADVIVVYCGWPERSCWMPYRHFV